MATLHEQAVQAVLHAAMERTETYLAEVRTLFVLVVSGSFVGAALILSPWEGLLHAVGPGVCFLLAGYHFGYLYRRVRMHRQLDGLGLLPVGPARSASQPKDNAHLLLDQLRAVESIVFYLHLTLVQLLAAVGMLWTAAVY